MGHRYYWLLGIAAVVWPHLWSNCCGKKMSAVAYFLNTEASYNPEYLSRYVIDIHPSKDTISMEMNIIKNISYDPMMQIQVLMTGGRGANNYRTIFTYDFVYCDLFGYADTTKKMFKLNVQNILATWITNIKSYGRMPTCPVVEGVYGVKNFKTDKKSIPPFVLEEKYRIDVLGYFNNDNKKTFFNNASIFVEIVRK